MVSISKFFFLIGIAIAVFSCKGSDDKENESISSTDTIEVKSPKYVSQTADSLTLFANIEQIEYCLFLPLTEYNEDYDEADTRAQHVFKHKTKIDNEIVVKGLFRQDTSVSIEDYFQNSFSNSEEQGEIVEYKELIESKSCFYSKGYMSNFIDKYKFIEIVWLRKEEVVIFSSTYDIKDTLIWNARLSRMLASGSICQQ